jgi:hypothetical protein
LQTIVEAAEDWNLNDIKGLLGRCNFKAEMIDRKVGLLSGGEKVRASIVNHGNSKAFSFFQDTTRMPNHLWLNLINFSITK